MRIGVGLSIPELATRGGRFSPASLFTGGVQGAWYDPSDYSTLFQDSAGTTPVTAVEQPVGLMLDKSQGLVLGSELAVNGDFASDTWWTKGADWVISGGVASRPISASFSNLSRSALLTLGKFYRVELDIVAISGTVNILCGGASSQSFTNTGRKVMTMVCAGDTAFYIQAVGAGTTCTVDNVSVKELPGNHASQATAASRPVLRARYNLLTYSEQFDNAAWIQVAASVTANATTSPEGAVTADKLIEDATTGVHSIYQAYSAVSGTIYTMSFYAKAAERTWVRTRGDIGVNYFNLAAGTVGTTAGGVTATIMAVGNGWYRCVATKTSATTGVTNSQIAPTTADNVDSYAGTAGSGVFIWGAQLVTGSSAGTYQRIAAATDYATAGFLPYLAFDGTDDSFGTNSINFANGPTNPPVGSELVTNGDFSSSSNWTLGTGWSIGSGVASANIATGSNLDQSLTTTLGKWYQVTFTVVSYTSGAVRIRFSGTANINGTVRSTTGTFTEYLYASSSNSIVRMADGGAGFVGSIDNISVKELDAAYAPDKMSVCAGVTKLSDAAIGMVAELSANSGSGNNGAFGLRAPYNAATADYGFLSNGTAAVGATATTFTAPITNVITGLGNISGPAATLRVNATQVANVTSTQGTGNYGNYPLYIGRRANASLPLNGRLYQLVVCGKALSASELAALESFTNARTGAY